MSQADPYAAHYAKLAGRTVLHPMVEWLVEGSYWDALRRFLKEEAATGRLEAEGYLSDGSLSPEQLHREGPNGRPFDRGDLATLVRRCNERIRTLEGQRNTSGRLDIRDEATLNETVLVRLLAVNAMRDGGVAPVTLKPAKT